MRHFFIYILFISLVGCMPASDKANGFHRYFKPKGLKQCDTLRPDRKNSMLFLTPKIGLIGGGDYKQTTVYWRSEDGGESWVCDTLPIKGDLRKLFECKGIVYGEVDEHPIPYNSVFQSNDQGKTWDKKFSLSDKSIHNLYFRDSLHGIINDSGNSYYTTSNGGKTWTAHPEWYGRNKEMNDSIIISEVMYTKNDKNKSYLVGINYLQSKQIFRVRLPYNGIRSNTRTLYSNGIVALRNNDDKMSIYELTANYTLKLLYTFKQPAECYIQYLAKYKNKIYIKFSHNLTDYIFFSKDGGKTWSKRKYYIIRSSPEDALGDGDTLRYWIDSYHGHITSFKN